jgi:hypothetical protein
MFRDLEHRNSMEFIDYQEILPVKNRVRRCKITDELHFSNLTLPMASPPRVL